MDVLRRLATEKLMEMTPEGDTAQPLWMPLTGPQTEAYNSPADIVFYGGAAGGGKTDLLLGLAQREHHRSVIFRRLYNPSLRAVIDRSAEIYGKQPAASYNEAQHLWRLSGGKAIRFGSLQYEQDTRNWQGQPHDLYGFDELPEMSEAQFRFVTGWNRTTRKGQRCRIVCTGNPPTNSDGEWVIRFWAPWLDDLHPNPAKPGELRWFTTVAGKDVEVPNGNPIEINGERICPRSRTFIPARVQDNPYLGRDYLATLQALPEPMRSKMLFGDFKAGREDNAYQVIPSEWVRLAQERWRCRPRPQTPMSALGVDVARGGRDRTIITPRYDNWLGEQLVYPGSSTPDGSAVARLVIAARRDQARVNIDIIGVGSSPYDCLRTMLGYAVVAMNSSEASTKRDKTGQLGFVNQRAEWWWAMRDALDPDGDTELALPPDPELKSDLCAPSWKVTARGIQVESKDEIIKRIGRSPDKGDSAVYAVSSKSYPGEGVFEYMCQLYEKKQAGQAK